MENVCKPKPVAEWIQQEETPEHCPPCLLQPLGDLYMGILESDQAPIEVIDRLRTAWGKDDILTKAQALDKIKNEVGEPIKNKLLALDCEAQSFKSET